MDLESFILESKLTNNDIIDHIVSIYYSGKAGMSIPDDLLAVKTRRDALYEDVFEYLKSHKKQVFKYVFMDKDADIAQVCKVFGDRKAREKQAYRNNIEKRKNQSK